MPWVFSVYASVKAHHQQCHLYPNSIIMDIFFFKTLLLQLLTFIFLDLLWFCLLPIEIFWASPTFIILVSFLSSANTEFCFPASHPSYLWTGCSGQGRWHIDFPCPPHPGSLLELMTAGPGRSIQEHRGISGKCWSESIRNLGRGLAELDVSREKEGIQHGMKSLLALVSVLVAQCMWVKLS